MIVGSHWSHISDSLFPGSAQWAACCAAVIYGWVMRAELNFC